jgi:hypothetical protein
MATDTRGITEVTFDEDVPVSKCKVDMTYGRKIRPSNYERMKANWNRAALGAVYLSLREDDTYAILDGHTRITVCREVEGETAKVPARVWIDQTIEQEADLFYRFNEDRADPTTVETFKANLARGNPVAIAINDLVESVGLSLATQNYGPKSGLLRCHRTLEVIYHLEGPAILRDTLVTLRRAWGEEPGNFQASALKGLAAFLYRYHDVVDWQRLHEKLEGKSVHTLNGMAASMRNIYRANALANVWGMALREVYNEGLRKKLPEWQVIRHSEASRRARSERMKANNPRRNGKGSAA